MRTLDSISSRFPQLSPLKQALLAVEDMQERLSLAERSRNEPIAIIGMGCRFPGASDPSSFWKLLREGRDAVTEVPASRWKIDDYYNADPDAPGKMSTRWGGFLTSVDHFDADFFGISPREAASMDPQQRLLLEVAWEALENAGQGPGDLVACRTGIFVGLTSDEYAQLSYRDGDLSRFNAYFASGVARSVAGGRISYILGVEGPNMSIDTACSSSLVALHTACLYLRMQECRMALAGGANVVLSPEIGIAFSKAHMMAPDGRCKAFDARADGFVRAEGCGVVVLKRLSDAIADGDHILAVIRGSAVNQDGRSSGITAPNGTAQEAVIRAALAQAEMRPEEIGYVEAHGTGTALGDPIEAHALAAVLGPGRGAENPLVIGSVKTNLGHLESAAGVAGLIKVVLAMQNQQIPAHLHFDRMNPHIDWGGVPVEIPVAARAWRRGEKRRVAGLSSFGFSGTNAHVILEEAPDQGERKQVPERGQHVLALSARSEEALRQLGRSYAAELERGGVDLGDLCYTANAGRAHFEQRLAVVGSTGEQMRRRLLEALPGQRVQAREGVRPVFLFPGQGAQYAGMGKELYETQPVFRAVIDECAEHLGEDLLWDDPTEQALFAVEYALAKLWQCWGIEPGAVLGYGVGEYVAACVAGVYSLADGLELAAGRSRLMPSEFAAPRFPVISSATGIEPTEILVMGPGQSEQMLESLAQLYVRGAEVNWAGFDRPYARRRVPLPTYPFQRQRYWIDIDQPKPKLDSTITDGWFYRVAWKEQDFPVTAELARRHWILLKDTKGVAKALTSLIESAGCTCALVGDQFALHGILNRAEAGATGIVDLRCLDLAEGDAEKPCLALANLVQEVARVNRPGVTVWSVTQGAQITGRETDPVLPWQAPVWALGRTIVSEHPEFWGGMIDLDAAARPEQNADLLWRHLGLFDGEDQSAFRNGSRLVARLERHTAPPSKNPVFHPDAAYLITGGFGGLGLEIARWMVQLGAKRIILMGRTFSSILELEKLGASVQRVAVDVGDANALQGFFRSYENEGGPPIRGVVHAAGAVRHVLVSETTAEDFRTSFQAKVNGTWLLHRALERMPLDFFVLFSSASAVLSSPRLGPYAASNAFLDAMAEYRGKKGLPALSVNWGVWAGVGMASQPGEKGADGMNVEQGLACLGRLLGSSGQICVLPIDWRKWADQYPAYMAKPFFSELMSETRKASAPALSPAPAGGLLHQVGEALESNRRDVVRDFVRSLAVRVLGFAPSRPIDPLQPLNELGMDSLMALELRNALSAEVQRSLPATLLFNYPSIEDIAGYLAGLLFDAPAAAQALETPSEKKRTALENIEELSDEEVDRLLAEKLGRVND